MRRIISALLLGALLAPLSGPAASLDSDKAKEQRWAEQIVDALLVGDGVWLEADGGQFLGIFAKHTTASARGAVLLLHGIGAHPDWPEVIHPLRSELPDHGWMTLSLQMPVLENDADAAQYEPLFDLVAPRINAGVRYLKQQGVQNIVIVAHSMGAAMASHYLANQPDPAVRGFVGIGMGRSEHPRMDNVGNLRQIRIPVLDLYGSRDLDGVLASARDRATAATRAGNNRYQQLSIEGADHFFNSMNDTLLKRTRGWLERHVPGTQLN